MLRRLKTPRIAAAVAALAAASAAFGQTQGGLAGELADAGKKLASDTQSCTPINLGEYAELLHKAAKNKQRAEKLAKKGVPVDMTQVDADLANAASLFHNAQAALVGQCLRAAQQAQGSQTSQAPMNLSPFAEQVLVAHNAERAAVGAPPLRWDPALEASATAHAGVLARTGQLVHAPREGRGIERENLSQGLRGSGPLQMMRNWINEKRKFKVGTYPDVSTTGDWADVSHHTQMIWPTTTALGCGVADGAGYAWLVCRYSPGGNKDGRPVGFTTVADNDGPAVPPLKVDAKGDVDTKVEQPSLVGKPSPFASNAKPSGGASSTKTGAGPVIKGYYDPSGSGSQPGPQVQLSEGMKSTETTGGAKWPDLALGFGYRPSWFNYGPSACDAGGDGEQEKDSPFKLELKYSLGDQAITDMFQETKVVQPGLGGQPEAFDPKAVPEYIIIQSEPYLITVTPTKISDCVM